MISGHDWIFETTGFVGEIECRRYQCRRCKMHKFERIDEEKDKK
jgi:hypothetical protein